MTVRGHLWEFPERTFVFLFLFSEKITHNICIISTIDKIAAELEIQSSTVALIKRKRENRKHLNAKSSVVRPYLRVHATFHIEVLLSNENPEKIEYENDK